MFVSVSGGIEFSDLNTKFGNSSINFSAQLHPVEVIDYTDDEASHYITKRDLELDFNDIKHLTGNNPLLLSYVPKKGTRTLQDTLDSFQGLLEVIVRSLINQHIRGLVKHVNTIEEYFINKDLLKCVDFCQCANRGCSMDDTQLSEYKKSMFFNHKLTLIANVSSDGIMEDEDDKTEPTESQKSTVIKWNFPLAGKIFREAIRNFKSGSNNKQLEDLCKKLPTFAGCLFESFFFEQLREGSDKVSLLFYYFV